MFANPSNPRSTKHDSKDGDTRNESNRETKEKIPFSISSFGKVLCIPRKPSRRGSRRPTGREKRGQRGWWVEEKKRRSGRAPTRERLGQERERRTPTFPSRVRKKTCVWDEKRRILSSQRRD